MNMRNKQLAARVISILLQNGFGSPMASAYRCPECGGVKHSPDSARCSRCNGLRRRSVLRAIGAVSMMLIACGAMAASVMLGWDPNPEPNIIGYNIYSGPGSRVYTNIIFTAQTTGTVTGLKDGETYYFAVTALDDIGQEGDYSDEVSYNVPAYGQGPGPIEDLMIQ